MQLSRKPLVGWLGLAALVLLFPAQRALACDACNQVFGAEMEGKRANSLVGRDFMNAVKHQQNYLDGSGLGSGAFKPSAIVQESAGETRADAQESAAADHAHHDHAHAEGHDHHDHAAHAGHDMASMDHGDMNHAAVQTVAEAKPEQDLMPMPVAIPQADPASASQFGGVYGKPYGTVPEEWKDYPFIDVIERDYSFSFPATSTVPQNIKPDKSFTITLTEGKAYIGNGVVYDGFLTNNTIPGPLLIMDEGDIVEFIVENKGTVPHGASIHAAYTQTSKYLGKINPGEKGRVLFRATLPGVYMYHCAPGGHAIPMHVMFGQYGMMVVKPKHNAYQYEKLTGRSPDIEVYIVQHELYATGKDAVEGKAMYTMYNGKLFRYIEEPIMARPGDMVRIYYLNVGPNHTATFHIVGIIWDFAYWQGNPAVVMPGGQTVTAAPSDSFIVDFRVPPDEGAYTILDHAVGAASRGAIGFIVAKAGVDRPSVIRPEGSDHSQEEMDKMADEAIRVISPFHPTKFDKPQTYMPGTKEVTVSIIGNSYYPKVIEIEPGTKVTWVNEDVFAFLAGEFAGIHNAMGGNGDDVQFNTPLLAHGESASFTFDKEGSYDYTCQPHPYMKARVIVKKPDIDLSNLVAGKTENSGRLIPLAVGAFLVALYAVFRSFKRNKA